MPNKVVKKHRKKEYRAMFLESRNMLGTCLHPQDSNVIIPIESTRYDKISTSTQAIIERLERNGLGNQFFYGAFIRAIVNFAHATRATQKLTQRVNEHNINVLQSRAAGANT